MAEGETVIVLLMMLCCVWQEDTSAIDYEKITAQIEKACDDKAKELPDTIKDIRRKITTVRRKRMDSKVKRQQIQELEADIETAKENAEKYKSRELLVAERLVIPAEIGNFGTLESCHIKQVTGVDSMLCEIGYTRQRPRGSRITLADHTSKDFLIKSYPTKGLIDRSGLKDKETIFVVTGTETYNNVGGSTTTVFVLEPLDIEKIKEELKRDKDSDSN